MAAPVVVLVEDNADIADATKQLLAQRGYAVVVAGNATEALEKMALIGPVDLAFIDVDLPGGNNGIWLARRISQQYPGVRVALTSGFPIEEDVPWKVLPKPYTVATLKSVFEDMMSGHYG